MTTEHADRVPNYKIHRNAVASVDATLPTDVGVGINMKDYRKALIQVVPSAADPTVIVNWWSEAVGAFIPEHVTLSKAGIGAGLPFEFEVDCNGRIMFVEVSVLASGTIDVHVAGFDKALER